MLILDLFCGAGGAAAGYHRAGFGVVGVDRRPQPRYPFPFAQGDALEALSRLLEGVPLVDAAGGRWFDHDFSAIHASPPCQAHSAITTARGRRADHADLTGPTRRLLTKSGRPWVMENVAGSPLSASVILCGSMFGLGVRRHRLFETSHLVLQPDCRHRQQGAAVGVYGHSGGKNCRTKERKYSLADWKAAMGVDWMTGRELAQAIPPAYTEYLGRQLISQLGAAAPAWVPCPCCENYLCVLHGKHAHECECPPAEEWGRSPYGEQRNA